MTDKVVKMDKVYAIWVCPECNLTVKHSYSALAEVGNPICPDCDADMELSNEYCYVRN
jgi:rubrerythrin